MILYRHARQLRVRRSAVPEPPFWSATSVAPYSARRATPIAIDYLTLRATGGERLEVDICDDVEAALDAQPRISAPLLVDAAERIETVFGRGAAVAGWCRDRSIAATMLTSTESVVPRASAVAIAAWPLDLAAIEARLEEARERAESWGVFVPLLYPATTDIAALERLADLAVRGGARWLTAGAVELDATARQALARSPALGDDEFDALFHADLDPLLVATERHVAALAAERALGDFAVPPRWDDRSNWNAAVLLTRTAARMIAMERENELATGIARAARVVAGLAKPLERIAASASLAIVDGLGDIGSDILTDWLESGRSAFVDGIDREWRLRRDHYGNDEG